MGNLSDDEVAALGKLPHFDRSMQRGRGRIKTPSGACGRDVPSGALAEAVNAPKQCIGLMRIPPGPTSLDRRSAARMEG